MSNLRMKLRIKRSGSAQWPWNWPSVSRRPGRPLETNVRSPRRAINSKETAKTYRPIITNGRSISHTTPHLSSDTWRARASFSPFRETFSIWSGAPSPPPLLLLLLLERAVAARKRPSQMFPTVDAINFEFPFSSDAGTTSTGGLTCYLIGNRYFYANL